MTPFVFGFFFVFLWYLYMDPFVQICQVVYSLLSSVPLAYNVSCVSGMWDLCILWVLNSLSPSFPVRFNKNSKYLYLVDCNNNLNISHALSIIFSKFVRRTIAASSNFYKEDVQLSLLYRCVDIYIAVRLTFLSYLMLLSAIVGQKVIFNSMPELLFFV